ncbi:MAG: ATP-binding protein [Desulfobacula sp.]|nr:ATP-binding protein [Desulfobacula sp.]
MKQKKFFFIPPAVLAGVLLIIVPVFVGMTHDRLKRQEEFFTQKLLEKGISLIRTFEAGTRAGMLNMHWGAKRIQTLLTETALQPDVVYMMITTREGRILSHSDASLVDGNYSDMPMVSKDDIDPFLVYHRVLNPKKKQAVFEVYKRFVPIHDKKKERPGRMHRMHIEESLSGMQPNGSQTSDIQMNRDKDWSQQYLKHKGHPDSGSAEHYMIAGLSMDRVRIAGNRLVKKTVWQAVVYFLLVCAGMVTLFAFQAYRSTKASLSTVKAYSDAVIQNMPAGLVTMDKNGKVTAMNAAAKRILGNTIDRIFPQLKELMGDVQKDAQALTREISLEIEADKKLLLDLTASAIQNSEGELTGFLFLFKDLTLLKELKQQVETNKRLAAIGKLAAGVAHEIRNPLSSIKGFATYFSRRYKENEKDRDTARIMVKEVDRINRSITQLLEFAKPMSVEKTSVDVSAIIAHSLKLVEHDLGKNKIYAGIKSSLTSQTIFTDGDRLNQVLLNLYMNAIQAMPENGTLDIRINDVDPGGIEIQVCDNGPGIDEQTLEQIFEPYFTTRATGTGLGLSIVHRIMENLGGSISVDSTINQGTCFKLFLPKGNDHE